MLITKFIVFVYRIMFEVLALVLVIGGSSAIALYAGKMGANPFLAAVAVIFYLLIVVTFLGALAMQMDNNRLLRELASAAEAMRKGDRSASLPAANPVLREPPVTN